MADAVMLYNKEKMSTPVRFLVFLAEIDIFEWFETNLFFLLQKIPSVRSAFCTAFISKYFLYWFPIFLTFEAQCRCDDMGKWYHTALVIWYGVVLSSIIFTVLHSIYAYEATGIGLLMIYSVAVTEFIIMILMRS